MSPNKCRATARSQVSSFLTRLRLAHILHTSCRSFAAAIFLLDSTEERHALLHSSLLVPESSTGARMMFWGRVIDLQRGREAEIKSTTRNISGLFFTGWVRSEAKPSELKGNYSYILLCMVKGIQNKLLMLKILYICKVLPPRRWTQSNKGKKACKDAGLTDSSCDISWWDSFQRRTPRSRKPPLKSSAGKVCVLPADLCCSCNI